MATADDPSEIRHLHATPMRRSTVLAAAYPRHPLLRRSGPRIFGGRPGIPAAVQTDGIVAGAIRGTVAAMAMTGMRRMTTGLGLVQQTPPEALVEEARPGFLARVPTERRDEAIELVHWAVGAGAGALYGALPRAVRVGRLGGPAYGLAIWAVFEAAVSPLLGLRRAKERRTLERLSIAADHVLYGAVIASKPPARTAQR